jgi:hypothetical protein
MPISTMSTRYLLDLFYNYSPLFALLALVLIIGGGVFLAKENSVGWVPLLCGLVIGFALWGISKHQRARRAAEKLAEQEKPAWMRAAENNINSIYG